MGDFRGKIGETCQRLLIF